MQARVYIMLYMCVYIYYIYIYTYIYIYMAVSHFLLCTRCTPSREGPKHAPWAGRPGGASVAQKWAHLGPSRPRAKHHQDVTVHVEVPRRALQDQAWCHASPQLVRPRSNRELSRPPWKTKKKPCSQQSLTIYKGPGPNRKIRRGASSVENIDKFIVKTDTWRIRASSLRNEMQKCTLICNKTLCFSRPHSRRPHIYIKL